MDIESNNVKELYERLIPALNTKVTELKRNDLDYIKIEDMLLSGITAGIGALGSIGSAIIGGKAASKAAKQANKLIQERASLRRLSLSGISGVSTAPK